jgi:hypothetical protein
MQVSSYDSAPESFVDWLSAQIGEHKWIVARRSKARIKQGYDHFFTKRRFMALQAHFDKEHGEMTDSVSAHLTEPNMVLARQRSETKPGQAFWGGTGPDGKTCRTCARWDADGYMAGSGLLRDAPCGKYRALIHGQQGDRVPHFAKACKYFEQGEERPIHKPKTPAATS